MSLALPRWSKKPVSEWKPRFLQTGLIESLGKDTRKTLLAFRCRSEFSMAEPVRIMKKQAESAGLTES